MMLANKRRDGAPDRPELWQLIQAIASREKPAVLRWLESFPELAAEPTRIGASRGSPKEWGQLPLLLFSFCKRAGLSHPLGRRAGSELGRMGPALAWF